MSVPMLEQGRAPRVQSRPRAFLACLLTLLLAMASHADARKNAAATGKSGIEAAAHDFPAPLERKPDAAAVAILLAAIENALVKSPSSSVGRAASGAGVELAQRADDKPPEIARNETSFAKTQVGQVQNVSVHYKTVRVAEVAPLDAVLLDAMPTERNGAGQQRIVKVKADGVARVQPVSAVADADDVQPQKLAVAPRFAKADEEAGRDLPSVSSLQGGVGVAIYDIEKAKVYLPDGEILEAHSGIGPMRDNPAYVNRQNRGPTPPHIYDLKLRERPFHGVEAIRLTPVEGDTAVFGRVGFLAHTYMLGRPGDSNGCVVFKEYHRFLAAFKRGLINRLIVVPRLREAPPSILTALLSVKNG